jgi:DNA mismatch endonuclease Vsr
MDRVSPETRSRVMAKIRSKRNKSTEWRLRAGLIRAGIRGWSMNAPDVFGNPDFAFRVQRLAVFVDGCFWHGCRACCKTPSSNTAYWEAKIARNRKRDRAVKARLRKDGWRVLRIWEHELKSLGSVLARLQRALADGPAEL